MKTCRDSLVILLTVMTILGPATILGQFSTQAVNEFNEKVKAYTQLQKRVSPSVPQLRKQEENPEKITAFKQGLAKSIQQERAHAQQGDIFTPAIAEEFRKTIRAELAGKEGSTLREAVKTGNPAQEEGATKPILVKVNAPYPEGAPLSSMPPGLLLKLPSLPKGLQYRFVGRHLVLFDSMADLIVDYLLDVAPKG